MFKVGSNQQQQQINRYIGLGVFRVAAINPAQMEHESLTGRHTDQWKGYVGTDMNGNTQARVTFFLQNVDENAGTPLFQARYFLRRRTRKTVDGSKTQVIDQYGNTAWVTDNEFKSQAVPKSSQGKPLSIIPPYRPCCDGEDKLVSFLKAWLYTPNSFRWDGEKMVRKDDNSLQECLIQLDKIKDYWEGDFSEIKNLMKMKELQDHSINALLTVKQGMYNNMPSYNQMVYWMVTPHFSKADSIQRNYVREQQNGMHQTERVAFQPLFLFTPEIVKQAVTTDMFGNTPEVNAELARQEKEFYAAAQASVSDSEELPF